MTLRQLPLLTSDRGETGGLGGTAFSALRLEHSPGEGWLSGQSVVGFSVLRAQCPGGGISCNPHWQRWACGWARACTRWSFLGLLVTPAPTPGTIILSNETLPLRPNLCLVWYQPDISSEEKIGKKKKKKEED